jgi:hypothetical protein
MNTLMLTVIRDLIKRMSKNHAKGRELFQASVKKIDFDMAEEILKACAHLLLDRNCDIQFLKELVSAGYKLPSGVLMCRGIQKKKLWRLPIAQLCGKWSHSDLLIYLESGELTSDIITAIMTAQQLVDGLPETCEYDEREFRTSYFQEKGADTQDKENEHLYRVVTRTFMMWDDDERSIKYIKPLRVRPAPVSPEHAAIRYIANHRMHSYENFLKIEQDFGFKVAQGVLDERGLIILDNRHCRIFMLKTLAMRGFKMHATVLIEGYKHLNADVRAVGGNQWAEAILELAESSSWTPVYRTKFQMLWVVQ